MAKKLRGLDPQKPFYICAAVVNSDGSLDLPGYALEEANLSVDIVELEARNLAKQYGMDCYIYRCTPVRRIYSKKAKLQDLEQA